MGDIVTPNLTEAYPDRTDLPKRMDGAGKSWGSWPGKSRPWGRECVIITGVNQAAIL